MWQRVTIATLMAVSSATALALAAPVRPPERPPERPIDAWNAFNAQATRHCPAQRIRDKLPGDVNYLQEAFVAALTPRHRIAFAGAIARVDGTPKACIDRNGIACPTAWNMLALEKARLLPRFVDYACSHGGTIP